MTNESPVLFDSTKHEYRDSRGVHFLSVTQILSLAGLCDFSFVEEESRRLAMERGRSVHWMLELDDQGALDYRRVPLALRGYRKAYQAWRKGSGFKVEWIERQFISHLGYAGTIDRYGKFPKTALFPAGSRAVVDLKTGNSQVQDWVKYQLVMYAMRTHANPAIARLTRRIGLALHADGTYHVREFPVATWDTDWSIAMEAKRRVDVRHVDHERSRD